MTMTFVRLIRSFVVAVLLAGFHLGSNAQNSRQIALLMPDGGQASSAQIAAWFDAARDEGYSLVPLTDSAFLQLGTQAPFTYEGLIIPDQSHSSAGDALVAGLKEYARLGGKLMVVFDAAVLTDSGYFSVPSSRLANLVGVDYAFYDELRDRMVGLGNAIGQESVLRQLGVPPGKSMPMASAASTTVSVQSSGGRASFLAASPNNPGGLRGYDHSAFFRLAIERHKHAELRAITGARSAPAPMLAPQAIVKQLAAVAGVTAAPMATADSTQAISSYGYGPLTYPSYVTRGNFDGQSLLTAPGFGLMAGLRNYGSGKVLFVNMPLTYLKLNTDAMPLHGFLGYFAGKLVGQPQLVNVPNGIGGLTLNWHLDSSLALKPMQQLDREGVWLHGPFSIHMTAGPDTISFGDKIGFDLPNNPKAKAFLRKFDALGHEVGSHGGWIHDYYGTNASETNQASFQQYLELNRDAIRKVIGHASTEYSAPEGNNPKWAMNWLEKEGVVGYYFLGHTGVGPTRSWREGSLLNPKMWAFPVTPFGVNSTFEDFADAGVSAAAIQDWYTHLIQWVEDNRTSRLIYMHPPGAVDYIDTVRWLMSYTQQQEFQGKFRWYSMTDLARFMDARQNTSWSIGQAKNGWTQVTASHPKSLVSLTWQFPKAVYGQPHVSKGLAWVSDKGDHWLVTVFAGKSLQVSAPPAH